MRRVKTRLEVIRTMPERAHPLARFLYAREVGLQDAADAIGWSVRKLKDVIAWHHYPADDDLADKARQLGFTEVTVLFPDHDPDGRPLKRQRRRGPIDWDRAFAGAASSMEGARTTKTKK